MFFIQCLIIYSAFNGYLVDDDVLRCFPLLITLNRINDSFHWDSFNEYMINCSVNRKGIKEWDIICTEYTDQS